MRKVLSFFLLFILIHEYSNSQVTIASDDFENSLTLFTATGTPSFYSGNSGSGDRPANSPLAVSNTYSCGVSNGTLTLTSGSIDASTYTSIFVNLRLAAFSIADINGGLDYNDSIIVSISPDDGVTYYPTLIIYGNSNSYWSYAGGTGIATTAYDGNQSAVEINPSGGGERTTDGYSTINISNIPQTLHLRIRITLKTNAAFEYWLIDKFELKGTLVTGPLINTYPSSLTGFYALAGNLSGEQTYTVRGQNLTGDISINAPTGFEISQTSGSGFGSSLFLTPTAGSIPWTTLYTRMNSMTLGTNSGNITQTSADATNKNVSLTGAVLSPEPTVASTVSFSNVTSGSMTINFSGGNGEGRIVVVRLASNVIATPTDGLNYVPSSIIDNGTPTFGPDQFVVYNSTGNSVTVTGLSSSSTYYVAVYEFNYGGINESRNYYNTAGTGSATTTIINEGLSLTSSNTIFKIDFDNTVARVNQGAFGGVSVVSVPTTGQLNSNAWSITQFPNPATFGGSTTTGGGVSTGNVSTGNYYAFVTPTGNRSLGAQLTTSYRQDNTLRVQNNTGSTITTLALSYKLYILNNNAGQASYQFAYSNNNVNSSTYYVLQEDTTIAIADASPNWKVYLMSFSITGLSVSNGSIIYLRWRGTSFGTPQSDEIAWDDISMVANPIDVFPRASGNFQGMNILGNVELEGNTSVAGDINLLGQNIILGNNNLTVSGNVNSISSGYLQTNGTGSVILNNVTTSRLVPLGITTYNPLTISNGSGLNWSFRLDNGISNVIPPNNTDRAVLRTWTITPSTNPPPAGANITFQYNDGDPTQIGPGFNATEDVQVWHNDGFGWTSASGALIQTGFPGGIRTVTLSNWSQYSSFAISNLSGALPVKFGAIKALKDPTGVKVKWTNYTETNILYYTVERSSDARIFTAIGRANPILNNGNTADYSSIDPTPFSGNNFYRIAAIETNGKIVYSVVVRINLEKLTPGILVFPNPAQSSNAYLQFTSMPKGTYRINIFSSCAQLMSTKSLSHDGGSLVVPLNAPPSLKPGVYFIQVYNSDIMLQKKFIIK